MPQIGGRKSRKANRAERQIVGLMQTAGFAGERVPLVGAAGCKLSADITMPLLGVDRRVEVKCPAEGFAQIYRLD
jgi:Holliday junction resolvase